MSTTAISRDVEQYLAYRAAVDWSPRTLTANRNRLARAVGWLQRRGLSRWSSVTVNHLVAFLAYLQACGLSHTTREAHVFALRGLGQWLLAHGKVLVDVTAQLTVRDDDEQPLPPPPLSQEQVLALYDAIPPTSPLRLRDRMLLELLYACGLRCEEAVDMNVDDLDLHARVLTVRDGKGGRSRQLPLLTGTLVLAKDYLALRRDLLSGPDHGALLIGELGKRLNLQMPGIILRRLSRRVGFRVYPHLLRHSIAVHLLQRGTDLRVIQAFLGHADLDTTKIYLRLVPGQLRTAYDKAMPTLLPNPPPTSVGGFTTPSSSDTASRRPSSPERPV
jgi:site-specific recombinase XerD